MSDEFMNSPAAWCEYLDEPPDDRRWSVDRINTLGDYERGNIRWSLPPGQARNVKKSKNNTTGVTGVTWWVDGRGATYARVSWMALDGINVRKVFSVKKYGLLPAFKRACEHRQKMIAELNTQGAGYGEHHGK